MFAEHIEHVINTHQNALRTRLAGEEVDLTIEQAMLVFLEADPTINKRLVDWSVKSYIQKGFLWEDIEEGKASKVYQTLLAYSQNYKRLAVDQRNIYQYQSLGNVYAVIGGFIERVKGVSNREVKRAEREKAREETDIIFRSEDTIIAVPKSEYAAVWWGRGTQWCTAAENNNQFARYYRTAPLIVINLLPVKKQISEQSEIEEKGCKLQLWIPCISNDSAFDNNRYQFMDENDQNVTAGFVENNWDRLDKILSWAVSINGNLLELIPDQHKTYELCSAAVKSNWQAFGYIPNDEKTVDFIDKIREEIQIQIPLMYLPWKVRTFDVCRKAVINNPDEIQFIPPSIINEELCWISIRQNGEMLNYVPDELKTFDLCKCAIEQNAKALRFAPVRFFEDNGLSRNLWKIALVGGQNMLYAIPTNARDDEIIRIAVEHNGMELSDIPLEKRTRELCRLAVEQTGSAIKYVPLEFKRELYAMCVQQCGLALENIDKNDITEDLCWAALKENPRAIRSVPFRFLSDEMVDFALAKDPDTFSKITPSMRTYERCRIVCGIHGTSLRLVPNDLKDMALCRLAVETNGMALMYVPTELKTKELCKLAYKQTPEAFRFFPKDLMQIAFTNPKWHVGYIAELKSHWIDTNLTLKP